MKTTKILLWAFTLAAMLQGCNLDREPADYIDYNASFNNMQDAAKWDNGIYSTLRGTPAASSGAAMCCPKRRKPTCLTRMQPLETSMESFTDGPFCPKVA
mgnify:CR=1 FL=1